MDKERPSKLLERQHREIDDGIKGIVDGTGDHAALDGALRLLYLHIYIEEAFLFPPLEEAGLTMPVFVMKKEHGEMWPFMQTLSDAYRDAVPVASLHDTALALFRLLQVHNPKEEEVLYTAADRLAAEQPDQAWINALQDHELPHGWVCAMAT